MSTKQFHVGDVLSITTGRLVSPRHIDGVYDILGYMTGESLFTHQLPRASDVCKPELLKQHPQLASVNTAGVNSKNWQSWLNEQVAKFGEQLTVSPLPTNAYEAKNPLQELHEMAPNAKVIPIVIK